MKISEKRYQISAGDVFFFVLAQLFDIDSAFFNHHDLTQTISAEVFTLRTGSLYIHIDRYHLRSIGHPDLLSQPACDIVLHQGGIIGVCHQCPLAALAHAEEVLLACQGRSLSFYLLRELDLVGLFDGHPGRIAAPADILKLDLLFRRTSAVLAHKLRRGDNLNGSDASGLVFLVLVHLRDRRVTTRLIDLYEYDRNLVLWLRRLLRKSRCTQHGQGPYEHPNGDD